MSQVLPTRLLVTGILRSLVRGLRRREVIDDPEPPASVTFDSTETTFDSTALTWDAH